MSATKLNHEIRVIDRNLNRRRYLPCEKRLNFEYSSELHHLLRSQTIVGGAIRHHHCECPRLPDFLPLSAAAYLAKELRLLGLATPPILMHEYKAKHQSSKCTHHRQIPSITFKTSFAVCAPRRLLIYYTPSSVDE